MLGGFRFLCRIVFTGYGVYELLPHLTNQDAESLRVQRTAEAPVEQSSSKLEKEEKDSEE